MTRDYKPSEPVTLVTDLILAIQGFLFGLILLYYYMKNKDKRRKDSIFWVGFFISVALFALFGAISHGSTSVKIASILWPPTMIFGGISFIFFSAGVIIFYKEKYDKMLIVPVILVIIYLILAVLLNWIFLLWVVLLLICSVIIFFYAFKAKKKEKELASYIIYGLILILIGGAVQAIGGFIGYETMFGSNNEYLFSPHNDIFHIIAAIGLIVFFKGIKKEFI